MIIEPKPTVEVKLFERADKTQYFEVWIRSSVRPRLRKGSIVERDFSAEAKIEAIAGAIAEELGEEYNDTLDPGEVAHEARTAYIELNRENPKPILGDEAPL